VWLKLFEFRFIYLSLAFFRHWIHHSVSQLKTNIIRVSNLQLEHTANRKNKKKNKKKKIKHGTKPKLLISVHLSQKKFSEIKIIQIHIFPGKPKISCEAVAYPGILFVWGGVQQIQLRTEDRDLGHGSPLGRGSGGSCNFVQEISFHIVKSP